MYDFTPVRPLLTVVLALAAAAGLGTAPNGVEPVSAAQPAPAAPEAAAPLTAATLVTALKSAGYDPRPYANGHRLQVDEEEFGYALDVALSTGGEWLICTAHLAPIEDLTRVPAGPLLNLLATNDSLLGMQFSYSRTRGQLMLRSTVPSYGLTTDALVAVVEGIQATVRSTRGLWDTSRW